LEWLAPPVLPPLSPSTRRGSTTRRPSIPPRFVLVLLFPSCVFFASLLSGFFLPPPQPGGHSSFFPHDALFCRRFPPGLFLPTFFWRLSLNEPHRMSRIVIFFFCLAAGLLPWVLRPYSSSGLGFLFSHPRLLA